MPDRPPAPASSRLARAALVAAGFLSLGLGIVGAFLPVMPTTCFVLLAAACFARSSPRFEAMLLRNRIFGPMIRRWRQTRTMPRRAKWLAIGLIALSMSASAVVVGRLWVQLLLLATGVGLVAWISRIPTTPSVPTTPSGSVGARGAKPVHS